jgi:FkbH-like protein
MSETTAAKLTTDDSAVTLLRALEYPVDAPLVLRKRATLKKILSARPAAVTSHIGILGGATTADIRSSLEIFLLARSIQPRFYESEYGRFWEDILFDNPALDSFQPQILYVHTTNRNIRRYPAIGAGPEEFEAAVAEEMDRYRTLWAEAGRKYGCTIIQNNFELPLLRPLGSLEAGAYFGRVTFINRLNYEFARAAAENPKLLIHDIQSLAAEIGLAQWSDADAWFSYKMAVTPQSGVLLAHNLAGLINAVYGRSKKCLVLDLDNTLWGGVVGDDGVANLKLGSETAVAESFTAFQRYAKALRERGVLLAVCSKNQEAAALEGLRHPDGILRPEDFAAILANWEPKHENIARIAAQLNIGIDSLVFVDDNPVERDIVRQNLPQVTVPEVGAEPSRFPLILERSGAFESVAVSRDDLNRAAYYADNSTRAAEEAKFQDYGAFLDSLQMTAEILPFSPVFLDRITQLTNKTNQFNLTTRRYTRAEIEQIAQDPCYIHLYGRLADKFGDNGLISVVVGKIGGTRLEMDLWLMSCRVLKRGMEDAMLDAVVEQCRERGIGSIIGVYLPTAKNAMVKDFYGDLGFAKVEEDESGRTVWQFDIPADYQLRNQHIRKAL